METSHQTQDVESMQVKCWPAVYDAVSSLNQHRSNVLYWLRYLVSLYLPPSCPTDVISNAGLMLGHRRRRGELSQH